MPVFRELHTGIGVASEKKKYCATTKKRLFLLGVPFGHGLFIYLGGYSTPKPPRKKKKYKKL